MSVRQIGFFVIAAWIMSIILLAGGVYTFWPYMNIIIWRLVLVLLGMLVAIFTYAALDALTCLGPYWWKRKE